MVGGNTHGKVTFRASLGGTLSRKRPHERECPAPLDGQGGVCRETTPELFLTTAKSKAATMSASGYLRSSDLYRATENIWRVYQLNGCQLTDEQRDRTVMRACVYFYNITRVGDVCWYQVIKYKTAALAAALLGNPPPAPVAGLPATDRPNVLLGGQAGRWLSRKIVARSPAQRISFAQAILQCKMSAPRLGPISIAEAVVKTYASLTTEDRPVWEKDIPIYGWEDVEEEVQGKPTWRLPPDFPLTLTHQVVLQQLDRTVEELFQRAKPFETSPQFKAMQVPSTSSSVESRVKDGGNFIHLADLMRKEGAAWQFGSLGLKHDPASGGTPKLVERHPLAPTEYLEATFRQRAWQDEELAKAEFPEFFDSETKAAVPVYVYDTNRLKAEAHTYWLWIRERAREAHNDVQIVGLGESLKVRPISQGSVMRQTALAPLQKWLHSTVKANPMFTLIGEPCSEEYISSRLGKRPLAPDEMFVSGDYSAATDNLKSYLSDRVAWKLWELGLINEETYVLFTEALTGHFITNPLDPDGGGEMQAKGQLMGSIVSFPVLCIINGALVRFLQEVMFRRSYALKDTLAMINGDDNLWRGRDLRSTTRFLNRSAMSLFEEVASGFGFTLSVGKTYASREVAVINSEMYRARTLPYMGRRVMYYTKVKYTATSIFTNLGRSGAPTSWRRDKGGPINQVYLESLLRAGKDKRYRDLHRVGKLKELQTKLHERFPRIYSPVDPSPRLRDNMARELLFGSHRYGDYAIGRRLRGVLEDVPQERRSEFYRYFLTSNRSLLKTAKVPWFMPESLGGLGFPVMTEGGDFHAPGQPAAFGPSDQNRQVLMKVLDSMIKGRGPKTVQDPTAFLLHKRVMAQFPKECVELPSDVSTEVRDRFQTAEQTVYGSLIFEAYLTLKPEEMFNAEATNRKLAASAVRWNQNLWRIERYTSLAPLHVCPDVWEIHEKLKTLFVRPVITSGSLRGDQVVLGLQSPIGENISPRGELHPDYPDDEFDLELESHPFDAHVGTWVAPRAYLRRGDPTADAVAVGGEQAVVNLTAVRLTELDNP